MNSFYSEEELKDLGFLSIGENVNISKKISIYGAGNISIGNNVRIDDFCILSGRIDIGSYVHIAAYCAFYAGNVGIEIKDFSTTSSRCSIYAISDDYSGESMTNPMIEDKYKSILMGKVILEKHCIVGTNSTLLPGVILGEGVAIGAHTLVNKNCDSWMIYAGCPARVIRKRSEKILTLEKKYMEELKGWE